MIQQDEVTAEHVIGGMAGNKKRIPLSSVVYFRADTKYVFAVHEQGELILTLTLKQIEAELGNHPDCVRKVGRDWIAECRVCGRDYELPCEIGEFNADYSYCGGSDRCTP